MIEIKGLCNTAICYCSEIEPGAIALIQSICDREEFADSKIRIMPDVHVGKGCAIGTMMTITDKIVLNMVGVDIGCGMETVEIADGIIDFAQLDKVIRAIIPSGHSVRKNPHPLCDEIDLTKLRCASRLQLYRAQLSIGTLGGGNHFVEVDQGDDDTFYLVVHSGSRHLGVEVANYYQDWANKLRGGPSRKVVQDMIATLKAEGRHQDIEETVVRLKSGTSIPKDLAYVSDDLFADYLHDMQIVQEFAALNRFAITSDILDAMDLLESDRFTTTHNYVDLDTMILRKGSVSAQKGERILIPINMRDGSLICVGKGNPDWNFSAPHGAGRLMSRGQARSTLSFGQFRSEMKGVFSTSVHKSTLDESPMAYKSMDDILSQITPTVDVVERIRAVYNFKAAC